MNSWGLIVVVGSLLATAAAFVWLVFSLEDRGKSHSDKNPAFTDAAEKDVEHIFNDDFREELRNRGRLHFEKIIAENAMFLQQDLRLTTSQLNEFMKQEITKTLQEEFSKYEQSIDDAKQLAIDSIEKTRTAVEEERKILSDNLKKQYEAERQALLERFQANMAEVVNHYVLDAVGNQIDLTEQLEYIVGQLEANKAAIVEDIKDGT